MSYGVPVLAHDIPGNSFIVDEKTGLKFSSETQFAAKLEMLLKNEKRRDEIGMNAYFYIKEKHSTEKEGYFYRKRVNFTENSPVAIFANRDRKLLFAINKSSLLIFLKSILSQEYFNRYNRYE